MMQPPSDIRADMQQAHALLAARRLDEAEVAYRELLATRPDLADAHNELGVTLMLKRHTSQAADAFREAFRLQPGNAQFCNNLGIALGQLGQFDDAIATHERAIALKPDWPTPHVNLSLLLLLKG